MRKKYITTSASPYEGMLTLVDLRELESWPDDFKLYMGACREARLDAAALLYENHGPYSEVIQIARGQGYLVNEATRRDDIGRVWHFSRR